MIIDNAMYYTTTSTALTSQPAFKQVPATGKTLFRPLYDKITDEIAQGKVLTKEGNKYSANTIKNYKSGKAIFELFESENGAIYLEDISIKWAEGFSIFLMDHEYCKNTIATTLARIKAVLRRLKQEGIGTFDGAGIVCAIEQTTTVYNTIEELRMLLNADLSETPGYDRVRDIYVLQCFIGLRFSDAAIFLKNPKDFIREIGNKLYIEIKTRKTGETVFIPISRTVKQVCERYQYNFGEMFSYQYYNEAIKVIAQRAGITGNVIYSRTEGGKRVDAAIPKCELMSSHTARRTFATNAHLAGLADKDIMMITGHKTTASFYRYIRASAMESAIKIANHDFFNIDMPTPVSLPEAIKQELLLF